MGFGVLLAVGGALIAGYNAFGMVLGLLVGRSSLDWFVASKSAGGATPVGGFQPAVGVGAAVLAVGCGWLVVQIAARTMRRPSAAALSLLAFALICMVTSLGANDPFLSVTTSLRVLTGAVVLLVVEQLLLQDPARLPALLTALGASVVLPAIISFFELMNRTPEHNYVQGPFVHQNTMAAWLSVLIPLFVALIRYVHGSARTACVVLSGVACTMLLFTYCRAAWVGVVAALFVVIFLQERRFLLVALLLIGSVWAWVPSVETRLSDLNDEPVAGQGDPNSFAFRQRYWHKIVAEHVEGVPLIQNLTGVGLGEVEATSDEGLEPHNVWVQVVAETGALGTIGFIVFIGTTGATLLRGLRRARPGLERAVIVGSFAAGVNYLAQTLSQNLITEAVTWTYFSTVLGLGTALVMIHRTRDESSSDVTAETPALATV